jgi:hypothetical protein
VVGVTPLRPPLRAKIIVGDVENVAAAPTCS